ncbi:hypothetical protein, partial [Leptospira interrogans]
SLIFQFHWMNANLQDRRFFTFSIGFKNVSRKKVFMSFSQQSILANPTLSSLDIAYRNSDGKLQGKLRTKR